jgi:hypothetical protein
MLDLRSETLFQQQSDSRLAFSFAMAKPVFDRLDFG